MSRSARAVVVLFMLACIAAVSVACTPDRSRQADHVRDAVAAMPGVSSAQVRYVNDLSNGPNFGLTVEMPGATIEQIVDAAARVREVMGDDFAAHRQTLAFDLENRAVVERRSYGYSGQTADLDPARVGADAELVRAILPLGRSTASRDTNIGNSLEMRVEDPDVIVPQVLPHLQRHDLVGRIESTDTRSHGDWTLTVPLTVERWRELLGVRNAMPATVYSTAVADGVIRRISVGVRGASPARDLTAIMDAVGPSPQHKLTIQWRVADAPSANKEPYGEETYCGRSGNQVAIPQGVDTKSLRDYLAAAYTVCARD